MHEHASKREASVYTISSALTVVSRVSYSERLYLGHFSVIVALRSLHSHRTTSSFACREHMAVSWTLSERRVVSKILCNVITLNAVGR